MTGTEVVTEIVGILVSGIQALGSGIGAGISNFVTSLWFTGTGENQTMSAFAIIVCVFAAIALAIGLTRLVYNLLVSLGGNK